MYLACGTQAERAHANHIIVMKMSNLRKNKTDNENEETEDSDDDTDEDEDEKPELDTAMMKHTGGVNRLRVGSLLRGAFIFWNWWNFLIFNGKLGKV